MLINVNITLLFGYIYIKHTFFSRSALSLIMPINDLKTLDYEENLYFSICRTRRHDGECTGKLVRKQRGRHAQGRVSCQRRRITGICR